MVEKGHALSKIKASARKRKRGLWREGLQRKALREARAQAWSVKPDPK